MPDREWVPGGDRVRRTWRGDAESVSSVDGRAVESYKCKSVRQLVQLIANVSFLMLGVEAALHSKWKRPPTVR